LKDSTASPAGDAVCAGDAAPAGEAGDAAPAGAAGDAAPSGAVPTPRMGARVVVRDATGRLLLFQGADPAVPDVLFWFTPGGGVDPSETFEEAAGRELREEAGFELTSLGEAVREDEVEFGFEGVTYRQRQRFYAVEVAANGDDIDVDLGGWTEDERRSMTGYRWWSLDELDSTTEAVYPPDLASLVLSVERWGSALPWKMISRRGGTPSQSNGPVQLGSRRGR
jgi:ADP-ribose pyrophosphatase YjhB (NUDIX family)